jgi:hypothetical protein
MPTGLANFVVVRRTTIDCGEAQVRDVYHSHLSATYGTESLTGFIAEKAPLFYRPLVDIVNDLNGGFILTTFKQTLAKLPIAESFRNSHFGEIAAAIFAEELLGWRKIYSKLSMLTAENANAYKMDLLLYDPATNPIEIILGEAKCSDKVRNGSEAPGHNLSCYASLFRSLKDYTEDDLEFDLAVIKDRLSQLPPEDGNRLRAALLPYSNPIIKYAGFVIIDDSTVEDAESKMLGTRASSKAFEVDMISVEGYIDVSQGVFDRLQDVLAALRRACS